MAGNEFLAGWRQISAYRDKCFPRHPAAYHADDIGCGFGQVDSYEAIAPTVPVDVFCHLQGLPPKLLIGEHAVVSFRHGSMMGISLADSVQHGKYVIAVYVHIISCLDGLHRRVKELYHHKPVLPSVHNAETWPGIVLRCRVLSVRKPFHGDHRDRL